MPNDFYTRAYNPLPEQRVSSQVLKDEFARVEAGFDGVQADADRAIKLPEGTADQTLALDAVARANLLLAFNASGNITAIAAANLPDGSINDATVSPLNVWSSSKVNAELARPQDLLRSARTSNTALAAADQGSLIDITSGTFSQTFDAAAALTDGWWCYLRNSGTGDITLDPSGAETIDGLTTYVMYPGEVRLVQCNGLTLRTAVLNGFSKVFTASGNFIKPPGYLNFGYQVWSGGSSGQKGGGGTLSVGGGGAGCFPGTLAASLLSASTAITVGAGGAARVSVSAGAVGGDSSIGSLITVAQQADPALGGAVKVGATALSGPTDAGGFAASNTFITALTLFGGGSAGSLADSSGGIHGAGAGGTVENSGTIRTPGTSVFGGNGGAAGDAVSGAGGTAPGGGGGGTRTGAQSGAGARGEVRIWGAM